MVGSSDIVATVRRVLDEAGALLPGHEIPALYAEAAKVGSVAAGSQEQLQLLSLEPTLVLPAETQTKRAALQRAFGQEQAIFNDLVDHLALLLSHFEAAVRVLDGSGGTYRAHVDRDRPESHADSPLLTALNWPSRPGPLWQAARIATLLTSISDQMDGVRKAFDAADHRVRALFADGQSRNPLPRHEPVVDLDQLLGPDVAAAWWTIVQLHEQVPRTLDELTTAGHIMFGCLEQQLQPLRLDDQRDHDYEKYRAVRAAPDHTRADLCAGSVPTLALPLSRSRRDQVRNVVRFLRPASDENQPLLAVAIASAELAALTSQNGQLAAEDHDLHKALQTLLDFSNLEPPRITAVIADPSINIARAHTALEVASASRGLDSLENPIDTAHAVATVAAVHDEVAAHRGYPPRLPHRSSRRLSL